MTSFAMLIFGILIGIALVATQQSSDEHLLKVMRRYLKRNGYDISGKDNAWLIRQILGVGDKATPDSNTNEGATSSKSEGL